MWKYESLIDGIQFQITKTRKQQPVVWRKRNTNKGLGSGESAAQTCQRATPPFIPGVRRILIARIKLMSPVRTGRGGGFTCEGG